MYQSYFGMTEAPFSIAPNPRYLYMSLRHQEALSTLLYGLSCDGGFVLLTGEVGAGKTTICRCLLEQIPENCDVAYIFNPKLSVVELLSTVCDEFHIKYPQKSTSIKEYVDLINKYLLESHAKGRKAVLIIDEAQNLTAEVLEQMRLLTNLETNERKLLQILLIGQPELMEMLAQQDLRQLAQRVVARYHLKPLNKIEVRAYVKFRLEMAGILRPLFSDAVLNKLYALTGGVPRLINLLCDRALLGTFVQGKERVDKVTLMQAARELRNPNAPQQTMDVKLLLFGLILLAGSVLVVNLYRHNMVQKQQELLPQSLTSTETSEQTLQVDEPPSSTSISTVASKQDVQTDAPTDHGSVSASTSKQEAQAVTQSDSLPISTAVVLSSTLELPAEVPYSQSKELARAQLFQAWGIPSEQSCSQVQMQGLHCWTMRGGLEELRKLNLPTLLEMSGAQGRKFYVTLTKLDNQAATFDFGTKKTDVSLSALALHWTGNYELLSRLPHGVHENIKVGESGGSVAWLSRQLASVQGWTAETHEAAIFDEQLKQHVKEFQLSQGLIPDGFAGSRTFLFLSALADLSAPRLSLPKQGED